MLSLLSGVLEFSLSMLIGMIRGLPLRPPQIARAVQSGRQPDIAHSGSNRGQHVWLRSPSSLNTGLEARLPVFSP